MDLTWPGKKLWPLSPTASTQNQSLARRQVQLWEKCSSPNAVGHTLSVNEVTGKAKKPFEFIGRELAGRWCHPWICWKDKQRAERRPWRPHDGRGRRTRIRRQAWLADKWCSQSHWQQRRLDLKAPAARQTYGEQERQVWQGWEELRGGNFNGELESVWGWLGGWLKGWIGECRRARE